MADKLYEQLSALVDDECETEEIGLALRRVTRDPELEGRWERYHLIGDVLKGHVPPAVDTQFSRRLQAQIDSEAPLTSLRAKGRNWFKPVAGFALAASIAAVAVVVLRTDGAGNVMARTTTVASTAASAAAVTPAVVEGDQPNNRLTVYLVNHNSYASLNSVYGVLPYVRMASYQIGP